MKKIIISKEFFARLFVIAKQNKCNLRAFSIMLMEYDNLEFNDSFINFLAITEVFRKITGIYVTNDKSRGVYDDAYWCGLSYYYLVKKSEKPLSYILLKLPFDQMMDLYDIYHEMDVSSLYERFLQIEKEESILPLLCKQYQTSLVEVSKKTNISINTLKKYAKEDRYIHNASFQYIYKLSNFFSIPISLFAKEY